MHARVPPPHSPSDICSLEGGYRGAQEAGSQDWHGVVGCVASRDMQQTATRHSTWPFSRQGFDVLGILRVGVSDLILQFPWIQDILMFFPIFFLQGKSCDRG